MKEVPYFKNGSAEIYRARCCIVWLLEIAGEVPGNICISLCGNKDETLVYSYLAVFRLYERDYCTSEISLSFLLIIIYI